MSKITKKLNPYHYYRRYREGQMRRWCDATLRDPSFTPLNHVSVRELASAAGVQAARQIELPDLNLRTEGSKTFIGRFEFKLDLNFGDQQNVEFTERGRLLLERNISIRPSWEDNQGLQFHCVEIKYKISKYFPNSAELTILLDVINNSTRQPLNFSNLWQILPKNYSKIFGHATDIVRDPQLVFNAKKIRVNLERVYNEFLLDEAIVYLYFKHLIDNIFSHNWDSTKFLALLYSEPNSKVEFRYGAVYYSSESLRLAILRDLFLRANDERVGYLLKPLGLSTQRLHNYYHDYRYEGLKNGPEIKKLALDAYLATPEVWGNDTVDSIINNILGLNELPFETTDAFIDTLCSQADIYKLMPLFKIILVDPIHNIDLRIREKIVRRIGSLPGVSEDLDAKVKEIIHCLIAQTNDRQVNFALRESWASLLALAYRLSRQNLRRLFELPPKRMELLKRFGIYAIDGWPNNKELTEEDVEKIMQTLTLVPPSHLFGVRVISKHDIRSLAAFEQETSRRNSSPFDESIFQIDETESENAGLISRWLLTRESSYEHSLRSIRLHAQHIENRAYLLHEVGHGVWYYNLSDAQRDNFGQTAKWLPQPDLDTVSNEANFAEPYGMKNLKEDWATLYQAWISGFKKLDRKRRKSSVLAAKISQMTPDVFYTTIPTGQKIILTYPKGIPIK